MANAPEISKKWWGKEKPADIKGADLEKALTNAEKLLDTAEKKGDAESIDACLAALKTLDAAADKTIKKECDKKKHAELIDSLEELQDVIAEEVERLEEVKEAASQEKGPDGKPQGEEEDEKGVLKPEYLGRMIKKLRSGETLNFCFGLDKANPSASRLVLCSKRDPERLKKILKATGEFSNRLMTFGNAAADGKVLQFKLAEDAKEPGQIVKTAKEFLKGNKELKFKKLRVLVGNEAFEEDMPDTEGAGDLNQELQRLQNLESAWKNAITNVTRQIDALRAKLNQQNEPVLRNVGEGLGKVVDQFPDLDLSKLVSAAKANDRATYDQTLTQTAKEVGEMRELLTHGPLLSTIDSNPLVETNVHATVNKVLDRVQSELGLKA